MNFKLITPKVVLGVGAHPDDLDFMAGGTMAKFANAGAEVYYLIITDGSKGSADPDITQEELTSKRQAEQRAALKALGGVDIFFLDYCDGELEVSQQLKKDIVKVIRRVRPDVVITFDPSMIYSAEQGFINHPDHRAAAQATLDAVYPLARDHLAFPELIDEGLQPHNTQTALLFNFDKSNFCIDISETFDSKIEALKSHMSQISDIEPIRERMHTLAVKAGKDIGCNLAEAFVRIDIRD